MKTVLIACAMIEDEIKAVLSKHELDDIEVIWMERGYHDEPEDLNKVIAEAIGRAEAMGAEEILIAYGLCGNGALGWKSDKAILAMPKFDDCVNMMLCPAIRTKRNLLEPGKMYLTEGWTKEDGSVGHMVEKCQEKYGEKRGIKAMKMMLSAYHHLTIIDTGCYDTAPVEAYADKYANMLGFEVETVAGSIRPMEKLLTGEWDNDIIVKKPGESIRESDFAI